MAKILIAEDDAHMMRVLALWLTRNGHEVFEAPDGEAARTILADADVDLLVSDVNMPRLDGLDLVDWIRTEKSESLPIVMLSSRCDQDSIAADLKPRNVRVHPKPFSPSRLVVEIEQLLEARATAFAGGPKGPASA
jgi:DNA-binding response OmpR family regulator